MGGSVERDSGKPPDRHEPADHRRNQPRSGRRKAADEGEAGRSGGPPIPPVTTARSPADRRRPRGYGLLAQAVPAHARLVAPDGSEIGAGGSVAWCMPCAAEALVVG